MRPLASGDRVGPYVLEERIGQGGFGEVWRGRHSVLEDRVVAAKIPTDLAYIGLLRKEGVLQHRLRHPSIVELLDINLDDEPPYLIMEYVDGEDLRERIRQRGPLPLDEVLTLGRQILEALQFSHEAGVVHRDLKPANVLLPRDGGIKLTDFGLGMALDTSRSTLLRSQTLQSEEIGAVAGTLAYMAPEQRSGKGPVDGRADIFAFGVVLFEMLTGELPVGPGTPSQLREGLDPRLDEIYRKCCAPIRHRTMTTSEVLAALETVEDSEPVPREEVVSSVAVREKLTPDEARTPPLPARGDLDQASTAGTLATIGFFLFTAGIVVASVGFSRLQDRTEFGWGILFVGVVSVVLGLFFMGFSASAPEETGKAAPGLQEADRERARFPWGGQE